MEPIYLDYSATTPIDPQVLNAMWDVWTRIGGNPASQHRLGRQAKCVLEDAAEQVLQLLGADVDHPDGDRIIFTSGGTEANNLVLLGQPLRPPARVLVSAIEHPSTLAAARQLGQRGWRVEWIRARACGTIDLAHLQEQLESEAEPPRLVSVMLANNETGVLQPVEQVVAICRPRGVLVHTDATQAIGKRPVHFADLGVDFMTLAAHKFHGPVGIGAVVVRGKAALEPILFGGAQQLGSRPGTESVPLVVGLQTALRLSAEELSSRSEHLRACRDRLEGALSSLGDVVVNGSAPRLPHILNISFLGLDRQALVMALDLAGVGCSTGSACASGASEPSHVLRAMGLPPARIASALRLSVGVTTELTEVSQAADRILKAVNQLRA